LIIVATGRRTNGPLVGPPTHPPGCFDGFITHLADRSAWLRARSADWFVLNGDEPDKSVPFRSTFSRRLLHTLLTCQRAFPGGAFQSANLSTVYYQAHFACQALKLARQPGIFILSPYGSVLSRPTGNEHARFEGRAKESRSDLSRRSLM